MPCFYNPSFPKMATPAQVLCSLLILCVFLFSPLPLVESSTTFCGNKTDGLYPDPQSTSHFWKCWDNGLKGVLLLCPPNTVWSPSSLNCTNASLPIACPIKTNPTFNSSVDCTTDINVNNSLVDQKSPLEPIWNWNGRLQCYGDGCSTNGHRMHLGIPCLDAQDLFSLAERHNTAWIPAPHGLSLDPWLDHLNLGSQHWKIRFDSLKKSLTPRKPSWLKASIVNFNPAQKILSSWQGGPQEAQFALKGPLQSLEPLSCHYALSLEKPSFNELWGPFFRALVKEAIGQGSLTPLQGDEGLNVQNQEDEGHFMNLMKDNKEVVGLSSPNLQKVGSSPPIVQTQQVNVDKLLKRHHKKRHHHNAQMATIAIPISVQKCLQKVPWTGLVSTAMCYAASVAQGGALNNLTPCVAAFASTDLSTVTNCFGSLTGTNLNNP